MDWIVSLTPEVATDPMEAIAAPPAGAAIVELRLDLFPGVDVAAALSSCPLPVLATLRSNAEGGEGSNDPATRSEIIRSARDAGAALIDLEVERDSALIDDLGLSPEQVVLSWHEPHNTPERLEHITERMIEARARWIKVVPTTHSVGDLLAVLSLHRRFNATRGGERRLLTFGMGAAGIASRYLAPLLGPPIGFAAWNDLAPAAPGQITIARSEAVIGHLSAPPQRVYGVVGADVSRSLSPVLHAAAYRALGLPFVFLPISVADPAELADLFVPRTMTSFARVGLEAHGWAVTTPHKAAAAAAASVRAPRVSRAGAANTLILGERGVTAENTDADGVVGSLVSIGVDPQGSTAVVQGTGGAARGAAVGLHLAGAEVVIRGRSADRSRVAAESIGVAWSRPDEPAPARSILVNATPAGSRPDETGPFSDDEIKDAAAVVDMVYADHTTDLVARASALRVATVDGCEVLLHQGIAQFAAFTQRVPPKDAMRSALRQTE